MICSLSNKVGPKEIEALGGLEKDLGAALLAFSCHDLAPASLSDDQVGKVKALEKELGLVLVAVNS